MNKVGVITGATSGIGKAFAAELAKTHDLVLVARRKELFTEVSDQLKVFGNNISIIVADLAKEENLERLEAFLLKTKVHILINAAGFGDSCPFHENSIGPIHDMIYVHVAAATRLSQIVLKGMLTQQQGTIINVASVSGFSKINAGNLLNNATKAYLIRFSKLLQQNNGLKNKVKIQVLCPGFTKTEFFKDHGIKIPGFLWMNAQDVAVKSLKKINSKKTIYIPSWRNAFLASIIGSGLLLPVLKLINKIIS